MTILSAAKPDFCKPNVTSRNGLLMPNTTAYTSHVQNTNTWVIVEYHDKLWDNSKQNYTFVWAPDKNVQELGPSLYIRWAIMTNVPVVTLPMHPLHRPLVIYIRRAIRTLFICADWFTSDIIGHQNRILLTMMAPSILFYTFQKQVTMSVNK